MVSDAVARHVATVRELSKPGQALAPNAPTATMNNPAWWINGERTPARRQLHRRLLAEKRGDAPDVEQGRCAIILAGPPGAGKSTVLDDVLGTDRDKFLRVDADEFKRSLLREAQADGSYNSWLVPAAVREREAAGERFYPLEMASLVHEESSYLARALRSQAIAAGDNIVVDTVLSSESSALGLGGALAAAGYNVGLLDVEVPYELSEARIRERWEHAYSACLDGDDSLGGRWVPSEYAREVFDGPGGRSRPEANARKLAEECLAVTRYRVFRTTMDQADEELATPKTDADLCRTARGGPLVDTAIDKGQQRAGRTGPR